jgi:hypothetical protein
LRGENNGGHFFVNMLINMLLNFRWSIPAWLILAAHFIFQFPPLWVFFIALALWPLGAGLFTLLLKGIAWIAGTPSPEHGNAGGSRLRRAEGERPSKNPYSVTRRQEEDNKRVYAGETEGEDYYAKYLSEQNDAGQKLDYQRGKVGYTTDSHDAETKTDGVKTDEEGTRWVTIFGSDIAADDVSGDE